MYKCLFVIDIIATDGIASGKREMELPFAPSFDIGLMGVDMCDHGGEISPIDSIAYDIVDGHFYVTLEKDMAAEMQMSMAEAIHFYDGEWEWESVPYEVPFSPEHN